MSLSSSGECGAAVAVPGPTAPSSEAPAGSILCPGSHFPWGKLGLVDSPPKGNSQTLPGLPYAWHGQVFLRAGSRASQLLPAWAAGSSWPGALGSLEGDGERKRGRQWHQGECAACAFVRNKAGCVGVQAVKEKQAIL